MAGISSALNIAKNALLAFQTEVHVTSHNVANVDTEGYSRQKVVLTPYPPSPSPVGPI
ncbi:flagellar basal body protein, partial [Thermosulfurimonas sp.]